MSTPDNTESDAIDPEQSVGQFVASGDANKALQALQDSKAPGSRASQVLKQLRRETPPIDTLNTLPEAYTDHPVQ